MDNQIDERYRITEMTTVGEVLFVIPGADEIFERHGCQPMIDCTEEHHAEYMLGDLELVCHIGDSVALISELNGALDIEEAIRSAA